MQVFDRFNDPHSKFLGTNLHANTGLNFRIVDNLHKAGHGSRGQGMLEFAIVLTLLIVVIFGLFEVGRLLFIFSSVTMASREAARFGSAAGTPPNFIDCAGIRSAAKGISTIAGVQDGDITIWYDNGDSVISATCPPPDDSIGSGDRILVEVAVAYQPVVPIPLVPSFTVRSETARTVLDDVVVGESH